MRYDIKIRGLMKDTYPEFKPDVFYSHPDVHLCDDLIRMGICFVDRLSPAKSRILEDRLKEVIEYVKPVEEAEDLALQHGSLFLDVLYFLFVIYHDVEMELWVTLKMNYHNLTKDMRGGYLKTNENLKLTKDINLLLDDILNLENRIFDDQFLKELVIEREAVKQLSGFAEKFAKKFEIKMPTQ